MIRRIISSKLLSAVLMIAVMTVTSAAGAAVPLLFPGAYPVLKTAMQWIMLPLSGAVTSALAARSGISHYIAWLIPPVIVSVVPWLIIGYPLQPGVMLLCCAACMIGASCGHVMRLRMTDRE